MTRGPWYAARRDRLVSMLTAALAFSWLPLAIASVAASMRGWPALGYGFGLTTILWLLKLCDMFHIFERKGV